MRISVFNVFLLFTGLQVLQAHSLIGQDLKNTRVTIEMNNESLDRLFSKLKETTRFSIGYTNSDLEGIMVSFPAVERSVKETLDLALKNQPLGYKLVGTVIMIFKEENQKERRNKRDRDAGVSGSDAAVNAPENVLVTISGTVTDASTEQPMPGVNIIEKGTTNGTTTDADGTYSLSVSEGNVVLVFSFIGYTTQEVAVNGRSVIDITLVEDVQSLDEVVVVGYGTQKKVNLTGAVDNITSKTLSALQVNTIGEALQGQLPGVYVSIADGKPGRSAGFNIRGNTSLNGGGPLIVIDGVPQSEIDLNNISPHDIEEISVLKDAASTAIYGARASFGVILVTTKRGSKEMSVRYDNYFAFSQPTRVPEVYDNPLDYIAINEDEFNGNIGHNYFTDAQVAYPAQVAADPSLPHATVKNIGGKANLLLGGQVYNYYKRWFRDFTPKQNHRFSVGEETDKFQYYISGDYNHEEGALIFKPEKINRYTLRSNLTYKVSEKFSIFNSTSLVKRDEEHPNQYLYGFTSNVWRFIENSNPMMPEYVEIDGEMIPTDIGFYREFVENQSGIEQGMHDTKTTFGVDLKLLDSRLKLHADGTYQFGNTDMLRWWDNKGPYLSHSFNNRNIVLDYYSDAGPAKIFRSSSRIIRHNINAYATYDASFGRNNIILMGGYNQEKYDFLFSYADRENPLQVPQKSLNLASGVASIGDYDDRNASRSVFTRLNYNWDGKYLLEINGSYFLSSKFARENRGHAFIAGSAAWRVSEEKFFDGIRDVINNFKLRISYGSLGNADIGSYDYIPILYVFQPDFTLEGTRVNFTTSPSPKSSNFTWETVETIDFGVDVSFFRNKLIGNMDIYQRNTKNMLANFQSLPSVFGASVPKENIAALKTKGWELNLGWQDDIKLKNNSFSYGIKLNVSDYYSEITDYYNLTNYLGDYYPGQRLGEIWGLTTLGYFQTDEEARNGALLATNSFVVLYKSFDMAGTIKFDDVNGDGVIDFGKRTLDNHGDYKIIGNTTPRYQFGITLNAGWKGFDLNAFFYGVGKRDIYPGAEAVNFWGPYNRKYQVMPKHTVEERWTPENRDAYFPRPQGYLALGSNNLGVPQTKYLQDASFIRLKNLTLGYTLPKSLTERLKISNLRLYVSGQNLWEATDLHFSLDPQGLSKDPDANSSSVGLGTSYPIQRVYAFGFQVQL